MTKKFTKYSANGNHFLLFDQRGKEEQFSKEQIYQWCHLPFGVGADGIILLRQGSSVQSYSMMIYNNDGLEAKMCGNALRCLGHHLFSTNSELTKAPIETKAGTYFFEVKNQVIWVKMNRNQILKVPAELDLNHYPKTAFINTGVPHLVLEVADVDKVSFEMEARSFRFHQAFSEGTNVDFCQIQDDGSIKIRVYERGVEGETFSCGTGVAAVGLAYHQWGLWQNHILIHTKGGKHFLEWRGNELWYAGEVKRVFEGTLDENKA